MSFLVKILGVLGQITSSGWNPAEKGSGCLTKEGVQEEVNRMPVLPEVEVTPFGLFLRKAAV